MEIEDLLLDLLFLRQRREDSAHKPHADDIKRVEPVEPSTAFTVYVALSVVGVCGCITLLIFLFLERLDQLSDQVPDGDYQPVAEGDPSKEFQAAPTVDTTEASSDRRDSSTDLELPPPPAPPPTPGGSARDDMVRLPVTIVPLDATKPSIKFQHYADVKGRDPAAQPPFVCHISAQSPELRQLDLASAGGDGSQVSSVDGKPQGKVTQDGAEWGHNADNDSKALRQAVQEMCFGACHVERCGSAAQSVQCNLICAPAVADGGNSPRTKHTKSEKPIETQSAYEHSKHSGASVRGGDFRGDKAKGSDNMEIEKNVTWSPKACDARKKGVIVGRIETNESKRRDKTDPVTIDKFTEVMCLDAAAASMRAENDSEVNTTSSSSDTSCSTSSSSSDSSAGLGTHGGSRTNVSGLIMQNFVPAHVRNGADIKGYYSGRRVSHKMFNGIQRTPKRKARELGDSFLGPVFIGGMRNEKIGGKSRLYVSPFPRGITSLYEHSKSRKSVHHEQDTCGRDEGQGQSLFNNQTKRLNVGLAPNQKCSSKDLSNPRYFKQDAAAKFNQKNAKPSKRTGKMSDACMRSTDFKARSFFNGLASDKQNDIEKANQNSPRGKTSHIDNHSGRIRRLQNKKEIKKSYHNQAKTPLSSNNSKNRDRRADLTSLLPFGRTDILLHQTSFPVPMRHIKVDPSSKTTASNVSVDVESPSFDTQKVFGIGQSHLLQPGECWGKEQNVYTTEYPFIQSKHTVMTGNFSGAIPQGNDLLEKLSTQLKDFRAMHRERTSSPYSVKRPLPRERFKDCIGVRYSFPENGYKRDRCNKRESRDDTNKLFHQAEAVNTLSTRAYDCTYNVSNFGTHLPYSKATDVGKTQGLESTTCERHNHFSKPNNHFDCGMNRQITGFINAAQQVPLSTPYRFQDVGMEYLGDIPTAKHNFDEVNNKTALSEDVWREHTDLVSKVNPTYKCLNYQTATQNFVPTNQVVKKRRKKCQNPQIDNQTTQNHRTLNAKCIKQRGYPQDSTQPYSDNQRVFGMTYKQREMFGQENVVSQECSHNANSQSMPTGSKTLTDNRLETTTSSQSVETSQGLTSAESGDEKVKETDSMACVDESSISTQISSKLTLNDEEEEEGKYRDTTTISKLPPQTKCVINDRTPSPTYIRRLVQPHIQKRAQKSTVDSRVGSKVFGTPVDTDARSQKSCNPGVVNKSKHDNKPRRVRQEKDSRKRVYHSSKPKPLVHNKHSSALSHTRLSVETQHCMDSTPENENNSLVQIESHTELGYSSDNSPSPPFNQPKLSSQHKVSTAASFVSKQPPSTLITHSHDTEPNVPRDNQQKLATINPSEKLSCKDVLLSPLTPGGTSLILSQPLHKKRENFLASPSPIAVVHSTDAGPLGDSPGERVEQCHGELSSNLGISKDERKNGIDAFRAARHAVKMMKTVYKTSDKQERTFNIKDATINMKRSQKSSLSNPQRFNNNFAASANDASKTEVKAGSKWETSKTRKRELTAYNPKTTLGTFQTTHEKFERSRLLDTSHRRTKTSPVPVQSWKDRKMQQAQEKSCISNKKSELLVGNKRSSIEPTLRPHNNNKLYKYDPQDASESHSKSLWGKGTHLRPIRHQVGKQTPLYADRRRKEQSFGKRSHANKSVASTLYVCGSDSSSHATSLDLDEEHKPGHVTVTKIQTPSRDSLKQQYKTTKETERVASPWISTNNSADTKPRTTLFASWCQLQMSQNSFQMTLSRGEYFHWSPLLYKFDRVTWTAGLLGEGDGCTGYPLTERVGGGEEGHSQFDVNRSNLRAKNQRRFEGRRKVSRRGLPNKQAQAHIATPFSSPVHGDSLSTVGEEVGGNDQARAHGR